MDSERYRVEMQPETLILSIAERVGLFHQNDSGLVPRRQILNLRAPLDFVVGFRGVVEDLNAYYQENRGKIDDLLEENGLTGCFEVGYEKIMDGIPIFQHPFYKPGEEMSGIRLVRVE